MIDGTPTLRVSLLGITYTYKVKLSKQFNIPNTLFVQMRASNIRLLASDDTTLTTSAVTTFFSSSVLELGNIGNLTFNLTKPDSGLWLGEVIGASTKLGGYRKFVFLHRPRCRHSTLCETTTS